MTKYKIVKMNTTDKPVFTLNRIDNLDIIPVIPIKYYKSQKTAEIALKKRLKNL